MSAATGLALLLLGIAALDLFIGSRRLAMLRDVEPAARGTLPSLSVVIAARNEARSIEHALASILALDYAPLEIIVVDDRSDDGTGEIVRRIAASRRPGGPALRTLRIDELPDGWLGKNHALWQGARLAQGELLLFCDADVVMEPSTLRRAVRYFVEHELDHLALGPEVSMPGMLPAAFALTGTLYFSLATRPWKARAARSRAYIGIGAFNLVRRALYERIGGHEPIALRPDDDLKLGKLVKKNGGRQDFVHGRGLVAVEWYASLGELVRGLTKNTFAVLEYNVAIVAGATLVQLLLFVWPPLALLLLHGTPQLLALAAVTLVLLMHGEALRAQRGSPLLSLFYPLVSLLMIFIMWRSAVITLRRGGIEWRGTHYPLDALRSQRV